MIFNRPPTRVQPYIGYRNDTRLVLSARALRASVPLFEKGGMVKNLRLMLSQFISHEVENLSVTLELSLPDGKCVKYNGKTDREGFVTFDVALIPEWDLPPAPVWEVVTLHWTNKNGPQCVEGHVLSPGRSNRLGVISDIDDTIIETGVTGGVRSVLRNWRRLLAEMPCERIAAPGADDFYHSLSGGKLFPANKYEPSEKIPATRRPFFYISSSPWNLYSYLIAFMRAKGLPLGPLLLRDWGFNRSTFGKSSHGAHKRDAIHKICDMYPGIRFALIGDDTQADLPAYAEVVEQNPGRIAAVFIRTLAPDQLSPQEHAAKSIIQAASVPLWLAKDYSVGQQFLNAAGFTPGGETEQIIRAVEHEE
ncbi:phosphatase domain-containing protein [Altericroceibacterium endophyticum]|uniref:DUF2183 domain-containing protein n=1 Tax=Altericroceibacterium endophyticum TaxID=1808508 RepID=A0A6I4T6E4_9SPHN|nr:phosphatase domain-containing protein [Altericroceibacterium endophyticum]MXO65573.1 DUF2183 domain-containing protein [Altericroceibacterium endophyticum]